jgi:hypothetical protein
MEVSQLLDTRARLVVVPAEVATPGMWWSLWTDIRWPPGVGLFLSSSRRASRPSVDFPAAS